MRFFVLALVFSLLWPRLGQAHPHAWIDLETAVLFDDNGAVKGVRVGWLFDDFYSAFSLDGLAGTQKQLNELAEVNIKNLSEYGYFTRILWQGQEQDIQPVTQYLSQMVGNRLWLEFDVMLETPLDPHKGEIQYSVFDPTYYVEILHAEQGDPIRLVGETGNCGYQLKAPEPPQDVALIAQALDRDETLGPTIGQYFAETVKITCS